ncbi:MAG: DUF2161 domain-containing phosphodiesterase [Dongiaceae bacterium]
METALYLPVKKFLEARGFRVKGEVCGCDLVALPARRSFSEGGAAGPDDDSPPIVVIGELKQRFTLELLLQGVDRMAAGDEIWLAVRNSSKSRKRADGRLNDARVRKLCRLLGFGLLAVSARGRVDILAEPGPYRPRGNPRRRSRLLREHSRRQGDPAIGGGTRQPIMTAYRQQALTVAQAILEIEQSFEVNGTNAPAHRSLGIGGKPRDLKAMAPDAPKILLHNVYGWFARVERGVYGLTEAGREAVKRWLV